MPLGLSIDPDLEIATFVAGRFSLGITSLQLSSTPVDVLLDSTTSQNSNANKNITGSTDYTSITLTNVSPSPSQTTLSTAVTDLNPMVQWSESAWSSSDLTSDTGFAVKSSGQLSVPTLP